MSGDSFRQMEDLVVSDDEYRLLRYYAGDPDVDVVKLTNDASFRYGLVAGHLRKRGWLRVPDDSAPCLSPEGWTALRAAVTARKQCCLRDDP